MKATVIYFANPTKTEQDKVVIPRSDWDFLPTITFDTANCMATVQVDHKVKHMIRDIIRIEEVEDYVEPVTEPLPEITPAPAVDDEISF